MEKLIRRLKNWYYKNKEPIHLSKWTRDVLFDFITEKIKEINKNEWYKKNIKL